MHSPEIGAAAGRLNALLSQAKTQVVERDEVIDMIGLAMVAEQNVFLQGPPGVAKSMVFDLVYSQVDGASRGSFALTKGSTPETLIGAFDINEYERTSRYVFNTEDMLPSVHLAFIDEVFKGNALTRNAALQVLNERVFFNGGEIQPCPLLSAGAASNEYPDTVEDSAFWDRFIVRMEVNRVGEHAARWRMIREGVSRSRRYGDEMARPMSLDDLKTLISARREVRLPDSLEEVDLRLLNGLSALGPDAATGDRRTMETYKLAQAKALLAGRDEVIPEDLEVFVHTGWHNPEARRKVQQAVLRAISPELADIVRLADEIESGFEQFLLAYNDADQARDTMRKMAANKQFVDGASGHIDDMKKLLRKLREEGQDDTKALAMAQKAAGRVREANRLAIAGGEKDDLL